MVEAVFYASNKDFRAYQKEQRKAKKDAQKDAIRQGQPTLKGVVLTAGGGAGLAVDKYFGINNVIDSGFKMPGLARTAGKGALVTLGLYSLYKGAQAIFSRSTEKYNERKKAIRNGKPTIKGVALATTAGTTLGLANYVAAKMEFPKSHIVEDISDGVKLLKPKGSAKAFRYMQDVIEFGAKKNVVVGALAGLATYTTVKALQTIFPKEN